MRNSDLWWLLAGVALLAWVSMGGGGIVGSTGLIEAMAGAIQRFEGWYEGSRSYRNNNPGNLKFAGQAGAIGQDEEGHAVFESYAAGWAALLNQIRAAFDGTSHVYTPSDNLYTFFAKYAEANQTVYAEFVSGQIGIPPELPFNQWGV